MVPNGSLPVLLDFATDEPKFAVLDPRVSFIDGAFAIAQAFDFAAVQYDPALDRVEDFVLVFGFAIVGHHFVRVRGSARFCDLGFGPFFLGLGRLGFGGAGGLCFFLVQWLLAHIYFLRGDLKNSKCIVEFILGRVQDRKQRRGLFCDPPV